MIRKAVSMSIRRGSLALLAGFVVALLAFTPLSAQVDTGSVLGTVTDSSGGPISGATVYFNPVSIGGVNGYTPVGVPAGVVTTLAGTPGVMGSEAASWPAPGRSAASYAVSTAARSTRVTSPGR